MRASGILMHISSLPSPYGIGTLGEEAYRFADFLHAAKQHYWQILPIGPTSYGDSPYQSFSTHAGNPYFIDLTLLLRDGLLLPEEIAAVSFGGTSSRVDYGQLYRVRFDLLRKAYRRGWKRDQAEVSAFRRENPWLRDYALYMAIKAEQDMNSWALWPEPLRLREKEAMRQARLRLRDDIRFYIYLQFLFFRQWQALRAYTQKLGIEIIGDIPIYVPYDSADVWANPSLFLLDADRRPTRIAGCPPDAFSEDGQLWGNPIYDWEAMARRGYRWWMGRIASAARSFDVIRIDHFRGLESYWAVPAGEKTARNGCWIKGPGRHFIRALRRRFPALRLIAEDLGFVTPEVVALQRMSGYPGMKVLEFAFDAREPGNYLPHNYERNCVCYTGTHDNETLAQWISGAPRPTLDFAMEYLKVSSGKALLPALISAGMNSAADTFIAPIQDYLGLGAEARMNEPSTVSTKNWSWRVEKRQLSPSLARRIAKLTEQAERT
jgi:4-alpha-glucanotransferase